MKLKKLIKNSCILLLAITLSLTFLYCSNSEPYMLVTDEEASQPDYRGPIIELIDGPVISIISPEMTSPDVPFHLYVKMLKREGGSDVNMKTFKAMYLKLVPLDITDKFSKYVKGVELDIPDAGFPPGNHRIEFSVEDVDGNISSKLLTVNVAE